VYIQKVSVWRGEGGGRRGNVDIVGLCNFSNFRGYKRIRRGERRGEEDEKVGEDYGGFG